MTCGYAKRVDDINTAAAITPDSARCCGPTQIRIRTTDGPRASPCHQHRHFIAGSTAWPGQTWLPAKRRGRMRALVELPTGKLICSKVPAPTERTRDQWLGQQRLG